MEHVATPVVSPTRKKASFRTPRLTHLGESTGVGSCSPSLSLFFSVYLKRDSLINVTSELAWRARCHIACVYLRGTRCSSWLFDGSYRGDTRLITTAYGVMRRYLDGHSDSRNFDSHTPPLARPLIRANNNVDTYRRKHLRLSTYTRPLVTPCRVRSLAGH